MKRAVPVAAMAGILMMAVPAHAADDRGLSLGLRTGFGLPMGDVGKGEPLSDMLSGNVPLWFDLNYRVNRSVSLGGFVQYGIGFAKDCPSDASCSASIVRLGVQATYSFLAKESFSPWMGFGIGYESTSWLMSKGSSELEMTFSGIEFVNLQVGADFKAGPTFTVGPFLMYSIAQYSEGEVKMGGSSITSEIDSERRGTHGWLQFGLKGTFRL